MATIDTKYKSDNLVVDAADNFIQILKEMPPPHGQKFGYGQRESDVPDKFSWHNKFLDIINI